MSACQPLPSSCSPALGMTAPASPVTWSVGDAPFVIGDSVVRRVAELTAEEGGPARPLRIVVAGGGCSGFRYVFAFDDERKDDDARVEKGPLTVVVDPTSLHHLLGAQIEYEPTLGGARFVVRNPHARATCGCGSSFAV